MSQALPKADNTLPPIVVERVTLTDGRVLVALKPISIVPTYVATDTEEDSFFDIEYEPLELSLFAHNFDELQIVVEEELAYIWEHYLENTRPISEGAKLLGKKLQTYFTLQQ